MKISLPESWPIPLLSAVLTLLSFSAVQGQIFVANSNGTVGEYNIDGTTINATLLTGLGSPNALVLDGADLFIQSAGTIGEYTTSGATINASLITGLNHPTGIAVSGADIFVTSSSGTVGEYTTSGATVNASLITGLSDPSGVAVSGTNLYVTDFNKYMVSAYTSDGNLENTSFPYTVGPTGIVIAGNDLFIGTYFNPSGVMEGPTPGPLGIGSVLQYTTSGVSAGPDIYLYGLSQQVELDVSGDDVFIANGTNGTIAEYDSTDGEPINTSLVSGLSPTAIAVASAPEPDSVFLLILAFITWLSTKFFRRLTVNRITKKKEIAT